MPCTTGQPRESESVRLDIIARDKTLVAINKPAGLLVHRSAIDFHEQHNAQEILQQQIEHDVYPVHRLDKPTSGVLLFALQKEIASDLAIKFQNHEIHKEYRAIVRGHTQNTGIIDNPVRDKDAPQKPRKQALTSYQTLAHLSLPLSVDQYPEARYSMLHLEPESGRRHQLRQHLKHISHPIIGDTSYGKTVHNRFFKHHFECTRLLLHAERLSFIHPVSNKKVIIAADFDKQFQQIINLPGWQRVN